MTARRSTGITGITGTKPLRLGNKQTSFVVGVSNDAPIKRQA